MIKLKNTNDVVMNLNENDILDIIKHGKRNFDSNRYISILTTTNKFIKDIERFDEPLFYLLSKTFLFLHPWPF